MLSFAVILSCVTFLAQCTRDYSITFHTADSSTCPTSDQIKFSFLNDSGSQTGYETFTANTRNGNKTITFTDVDLGTITQLYMRRDNDQNAGWCFDYFYFSLANNSNTNNNTSSNDYAIQRWCSMEYKGLQFMDYECGGNDEKRALRQFVLDISSNSSICWDIYADGSKSGTNYASAWGDYGYTSSVVNTTTNRTYSIVFETTANIDSGVTGCGSTGTFNVAFKGNCTFYDTNGRAVYCNEDDVISTQTVSFVPGNENDTFSVNFTDYEINDITHMTLSTSSTDAWCLSKFHVLLEEYGKWAECDLTFFTYGMIHDIFFFFVRVFCVIKDMSHDQPC